VGDAELLLGLDLGGQSVAVPAEAALDAAPAHRLVARHDVLDVAGEQVAVVGQAVGERRAVVEDELVGAVRARGPLLDAGDEGAVGVPVLQDPALDLGEPGAGGDAAGVAGVDMAGVAHRWCSFVAHAGSLREDDDARGSGRHRGTTSLAALVCSQEGTATR
jgi:hypothetical protein